MRSRLLAIPVASAIVCLCFLWLGCQPDSEDTAGNLTRLDSPRPVALPSLEAFPESVREQIRSQHQRVTELAAHPRPDSTALGEAYGRLGKLLVAYELDHGAEAALLNALHLLPEDYRWPYYLGHLHKRQARMEKAADYFERALALEPDYLPARIRLADVYRDLGRVDDTREILEEALRRDPEVAVAHFMLGQMSDEPAEAIDHLEAVLQLQPGASVAHYPLARAYRERGELERSREHLARRGQAPVRFGDPLLEDLQRIREGTGAKIYRGNKLMEQDRYREAARFFEQAAAEDSTNVTAFLNLANAVAQLGEVDRAIEALEQVIRLDPSNSAAHYNLGILTVLSERPDRERAALEHLRAAVETDPGNHVATLALANVLWRSERCREAVPHFESFLGLRPGHVDARMRAAVCHAHLGQHLKARELIEAGYDAHPDQPLLQDAMVRVLAASPDARARDGERALEIARRLASAYPRPETLESLAMAYAELGRFSEAIQYQQRVIDAAEEQEMTDMLGYLRENLRRYEQGKPCRTPWPPNVFDQ